MNDFIQNNLTDSSRDFKNIVWEIIKNFPIIGGGELFPVEGSTTQDLTKYLDLYAGVDAWQIHHGNCFMRGIASRVQWIGYQNPYNTFTIRIQSRFGKSTEFDKRLDAIKNEEHGKIYPHLTVQAFLENKGGELVSAAVIETKNLILFAESLLQESFNNNEDYGIIENQDDSKFLYISWRLLIQKNILNKKNIFTLY